jgi:DNA-binding LacI/PurR family transcriptional regulator
MQDVAKLAGVTPMTVSNVIGNKGKASLQTRELVLRAAQELDFHPNAVAQSLARRHTNIIGLYSGLGYLNARNEFMAEIIGGLQDGCEHYRKDLLVHGTFADRSTDDIYRELACGKIDGLIAVLPSDHLVQRLSESRLPVMVVADAVKGLPSVIVDDAAGSHMLVSHLWEKGYRRVLYRRGQDPGVGKHQAARFQRSRTSSWYRCHRLPFREKSSSRFPS